jgi:hypothetical protein
MLRNSRDQAFYQAPLQNFPPLGREYIEWLLKRIKLPIERTSSRWTSCANSLLWRCPEILTTVLDALHFEPDASRSVA